MGNSLTGASQSKINKIANTQVTNSFFSDFVVEWSIARLNLCRERYQDDYFLTPLTAEDLMYIMPSIHESKSTMLFNLFSKIDAANKTTKKRSNSKTIDGLSVLAGIAMDCRAILVDRLKFAFILYDFDESHTLNLPELTMMVRTTLGGMASLGDVKCPEIEDLHRVAKTIFESADTDHDDQITLDEFVTWATTNKFATKFFNEHQATLDIQINQMKSDPNTKGSVQLSAFEDAEAQLLKNDTDELDLKQHYLGDSGLSDLIEDLRSHARHATTSIVTISLQGNGLSSEGSMQMLDLLKDAAADRFGALGHYLGSVKTLDLRNNSRIDSDIGPALLTMLKTCESIETIVLTGTSISNKMKRQINMMIQDKMNKNKGINNAKQDAFRDAEGTSNVQNTQQNDASKNGSAAGKKNRATLVGSGVMLHQGLLNKHKKWKQNVRIGIKKRDDERIRVKELLDLKVHNHKTNSSSPIKKGKNGKKTARVGGKTKILWQEFTEEGDMTMYTEESQIKRERLKSNTEIVSIIHHWWSEVILAKYDKDHDDNLDKQEYIQLHKALGRALADPSADDVSNEVETTLAEEDWKEDTNGQNFLNEKMFIRSIFQLADHWCEGLEIDEYVQFLEYLFTKLYEFSATDDTMHVQGNIASRATSDHNRRGEDGDIVVPNFIKRQVSLKEHMKNDSAGANLSYEMLHELRVEFERYSNDGRKRAGPKKLNYRQFRDTLNTIGLGTNSSLSNRVFEVLDRDSSGFIDWHEFLVGVSTLVDGTPKEIVRLAFKVFDNNQNGTLSFNEVHMLLTHMSRGGNTELNHSKVIQKITDSLTHKEFQKFDANNSQTLNVKQFEQLCWKHPDIISLILGVDILDRTEMHRDDSSEEESSNSPTTKIRKANQLAENLSDIDALSVQELLVECKKRNITLNGETDQNVLRKRVKSVLLNTFNDA